ncbi:hypothetical protein LSH36_58g19056 [Paralvinella palmiformis]|uniref:Uncharacterized protein n=1 Tax=Paralvinella palmiformis TaxID=53620 RepID=A0AAD9K4Q5_9ANNE|nr:hypothetical protein LSH36_58g19056 [Paralvinella palmiformis]
MATYPTLLAEQGNKDVRNKGDNADEVDLIHHTNDGDDNDDINSVACDTAAGVTGDHTKSECLSLINKIWKNGLSCKLEQFRNRSTSTPPAIVIEAEAGSCKRCLDVKSKVYAISDSGCGIKPAKPGHLGKKDWSFLSSGGGKSGVGVEPGLENKETNKVTPSDRQDNEELAALSVSSLTASKVDILPTIACGISCCHDDSKTLPPSIGDASSVLEQDADSSMADIPPFKKARYSWQVKNRIKGIASEESDAAIASSHLNPLSDASSATDLLHSGDGDVTMTSVGHRRVCVETSIKSDVIKGDSGRHLPSSCDSEDVEMSHEASPEQARIGLSNEPTQSAPHRQDFSKLTEALTQLTHTERWQCQHVAKAIVDNAINKTLEEMGLAPGSNGAVYREQRSRIEDAGVSQAILSRGLRRYSPSSYCMHRLNPLIDRLTNMSEDMLSERLVDHGADTVLETNDSTVTGQLVTPDMMDIYFNLDGPLSGQADGNLQEDVTADACRLPSLSSDVETDLSSASIAGDFPALLQSEKLTSCSSEASMGGEVFHSKTECSLDSSPGTDTICFKQGTTLNEIEKGPSSKYVLDQAVNAVICERGLQCHDFF